MELALSILQNRLVELNKEYIEFQCSPRAAVDTLTTSILSTRIDECEYLIRALENAKEL